MYKYVLYTHLCLILNPHLPQAWFPCLQQTKKYQGSVFIGSDCDMAYQPGKQIFVQGTHTANVNLDACSII